MELIFFGMLLLWAGIVLGGLCLLDARLASTVRQYHISKITKKSGRVVYSVCYYRKAIFGGSWETYPQEHHSIEDAQRQISQMDDAQTLKTERLDHDTLHKP